MLNVFTVDVEDYFHPTELSKSLPISRWSELTPRVQIGIDLLLETLNAHSARATFFILGWIAERHPILIRRIADAGHEIGCHSHLHRLVYNLSPSTFREDTLRASKAIEDACGVAPKAYRAPSYSIVQQNLWALEVLVECGFTHDSSIFPIVHDRYGIPGFYRHAQAIETPSGSIFEVPVATVKLSSGRIAPVGGGAYLRLFPYRYTSAGIHRLNTVEGQPACIYVHPWELDPDQPRLTTGLISRVRTYSGLRTVEKKITRLVSEFSFSTIALAYAVARRRSAGEGAPPAYHAAVAAS
jgi:polysaccharide deacetylase family protein (PEP-CTERM system associated)